MNTKRADFFLVIDHYLSNPEIYYALNTTFQNINDNEWFLTFVHAVVFSFVFYLSTFIYTELGIC